MTDQRTGQPTELRDFALPDVGEGLTEAEILRWLVQPGDVVEVNQMIVEIETAKAAVELPSPFAGTVARLHVDAGAVVPVGTTIITVEVAPQQAAERRSVLVGYGVRDEASAPRRRRSRRMATDAAPVVDRLEGPVRAKPPVRKLARDLGVDLATITPTGLRGEVTRQDVQSAAGPGREELIAPVASSAPAGASSGQRIPVRGVHRAMAEAMVSSAFTAPHVTEWVDVDMSRALEVLGALRERHPGVRLTPMTLVAAGLVRAATRHPMVNATWVEEPDGPHVQVHGQVNLGIAADTPRGLLVPVIRDADRLGLIELGSRIDELVTTARAGNATPGHLTGGTITLTNIGVFGIDGGTPILPPGQAAILAMGRIVDRAWVVQGAILPRPVMQLALSFDHRIVDGATGSRALREAADFLADPALALVVDGGSVPLRG
jgi:pyruvate dehydrogenase E2 component (dihydrolipoamide acetyltransferase)